MRLLLAIFVLTGLRVEDDRGKPFFPIRQPERIVSLAPSVTEMLVVLGLKDAVVGATYWDSALVPGAEVVLAGEGTLNFEKLVSLEPQIVVAAPIISEGEVERLEGLRVPVFYLRCENLLQIFEDLRKLAALFGREKLGERMRDSLLLELENLERRVKGKPKRMMILIDTYGGLWTTGKGTFLDDLIKRAGGVNIFGDLEGWNMVSKEAILKKDPEVIILGWGADSTVLKEKGFESISAVREGRVYRVPNPDLLSRPSLGSLDALKWLIKVIWEKE